ncbi:MAG: sugar phosphate isomerase/epimerase [Lentisphaerae bacterium]|nr:sugar phosphate isomerase/epimerase [Lentisphaerota bacterium]
MARVTAMSSIAYAYYSLYDALPRIARRGYKQVEIGSFGNYCYHFNSGSPRPTELKELLTDYDLKPIALNWSHDCGRAYDPCSAREVVDGLKRKMDDALEVGIPMMAMHIGVINDRDDQAEQRKTAAEAYYRVGEYARSCDMKMILELPHLHLIHHTVESVCELLAQLDLPNVGVLLDSSHWGVIGYDLDEYLELLGDRLWHIHLRDSNPRVDMTEHHQFIRPQLRGKKPYVLTLTPGFGTVDFARLSAALDRVGYKGDITTEFEYFDMPLDEIERQYDAGLAHIRKCGWELPATVLSRTFTG